MIFARSGEAILDNTLATMSVISKKFRKEAFAYLFILLVISRRLKQLDTEGRHGLTKPHTVSRLCNLVFCDGCPCFQSEIANILSRLTFELF